MHKTEHEKKQFELLSKMSESAVPSKLVTAGVKKEAYLMKQSPSLLKNWQRRWFCLSGNYLNYYESNPQHDVEEAKSTLKGSIDLHHLDTVKMVDAKNCEFHITALKVSDSGESLTKVRCSSPEEAEAWIQAIQGSAKAASLAPKPEVKKVLMVLTSHDKLGDTGEQTGWYLPEAAHPYKVFSEAGLEMEFASPQGGLAPLDEGSITASKEDAVCMSFAEDEEKKKLWSETKALADCKAADYCAVFFVGG